jgi:hypothetical protein
VEQVFRLPSQVQRWVEQAEVEVEHTLPTTQVVQQLLVEQQATLTITT